MRKSSRIEDSDDNNDLASNFNTDGVKNNPKHASQRNFNTFNFSENCLPKNNFLDKKELKKRVGSTGRPGQQAATAAIPIKTFTVDF